MEKLTDEPTGQEDASGGRYASRMSRARAALRDRKKKAAGSAEATAPLLINDLLNVLELGEPSSSTTSSRLSVVFANEPVDVTEGGLQPLTARVDTPSTPAAPPPYASALPPATPRDPTPAAVSPALPVASADPSAAYGVGSWVYVKRSGGGESLALVEKCEGVLFTVLIHAPSESGPPSLRKQGPATLLRPAPAPPAHGVEPMRWATVIEYAKCKGTTPNEALAAADARGISTADLRGHIVLKLRQRDKLVAMLRACEEPGKEGEFVEMARGWSNEVQPNHRTRPPPISSRPCRLVHSRPIGPTRRPSATFSARWRTVCDAPWQAAVRARRPGGATFCITPRTKANTKHQIEGHTGI
jgi:hypothetical protein